MSRKEVSTDAIAALNYARTHHDCIEWIALDAFRIWWERPYHLEDGTVGRELLSTEFEVKRTR